MNRLVIIILLKVYVVGLLCGQHPYFKFHILGDPYSNATIEKIYEDPFRWIWFGSDQGLFRYDGQLITPYLKQDSTSDHVTAIFRDRSSKLWVGYKDGSIYHLINNNLKVWQPEEGLPAVPIVEIIRDENMRIWLATYGEGVYYYENSHMYNFNTDDGLLGNDIYTMIKDKEGRIWVGTDRGISICWIEKGNKLIKNITREQGLPDNIVRALRMDHLGNIWIGLYDNGFCYYDTASDYITKTSTDWVYGPVNDIEIVEDRELLIGTDSHGLFRYRTNDNILKNVKAISDLQESKIYDLIKDQEGNIWISNNNHGIFSANLQFEVLATNLDKIQALLVDKAKTLWIGAEDGLYSYKDVGNAESVFEKQLSSYELNVISLFQDKHGIIWIGTFGNGVYCFDPVSGAIRHITERDGLTNSSVLSIKGSEDKIWLATLGGVTEFRCEANILEYSNLSFENYNQSDGLGTNFIYTVFVDSKKRVWFATDGKGISVLDNGQIVSYEEIQYLDSDDGLRTMKLKAVYSITEDKNGHIWFSTAKDGIFEFDGSKFRHLTIKQGIRNLEITSLITDANGQILIVHPSGIDLLNPDTHHLIYYGDEVGLLDLDPNLNAFCTNTEGQIWIADQSDLLLFNPMKENLVIHPGMELTNVSVDFESIDVNEKKNFSYQENNFVFRFKGLWYTNPSRVKYKYRLEGYDKDWIETRDHTATYASLTPGQYTFEVASTENEAWDDEPTATYSFAITPPVWRRAWFLILSFIVLINLFYWYQKLRDNRIQRLNILQREKVESQLAALKAQINPHFLFNSFNTLIYSIEEDPKKATEYVEKLSDFYRSVLKYRDDEVIPLREEIKLVQDFHYLLQKRFGDNFKMTIKINNLEGYIPPLALQLLVENAVKHNIVSKAKPLSVDINMNADHRILVKNNIQPKLNEQSSTHFGLQGLKKRYELLGGYKVIVSKDKDHFLVSLPILRSNKL